MPFSSTPVTISRGDTIELRYPTPETWNTTVTFQVQIGQGFDNITVGTKLPDSRPTAFTFTDNSASTNPNALLAGDFVSNPFIQRNTTYYSNLITVGGIELRVPIRIQSSASGPKGTYPNLASSAAYSINGGPYITVANSFTAVSLTTTAGSRNCTVSSTAGLAVGMYVITPRITGEILQIAGTTLTIVEPASSSGTSNGNAYFTVRQGDTVRCRVTTENWYTTNSNVTITISDNYWESGAETSDTWSITTRAQDQTINTLTNTTFVDYVDERPINSIFLDPSGTYTFTNFGDYKTVTIPITGIDSDVVLEATSTGDMQISSNNVNWSQNVQNLVLGDNLYVRTLIGNDFTTKTSGSLTVFANPGDTYTRGSNNYENNTPGTYGTGIFQVTQLQGTTTDNQQIWTEVDRYPDYFTLDPVFTFSDEIPRVDVASSGTGYAVSTIYTTTNLTNPAATGLTLISTSVGPSGELAAADIVERGQGYSENDLIQVNGGTPGDLATFIVLQYRTVTVSSQNTVPNSEPSRYYYVDTPISGLGVEYPNNTYSDLEAPIVDQTSSGSPTFNTSSIANDNVEIEVQVTNGAGRIRKNGAGTWVQQLFVQNGDVLNLRLESSPNFAGEGGDNGTRSTTIRLQGPPSANSTINPTLGPTNPTFADIEETLTLENRAARIVPSTFRALPVFDADPDATIQQTIDISGLDRDTTLSVVSSSFSSNAQVSANGITWFGGSVTLPANSTVAYVRLQAGAAGSIREVVYRIGIGTVFAEDKFVVYAKKDTYTYQTLPAGFDSSFNLPQWADFFDVMMVGAGGGNGGADLPASYGGIGGKGNILVGQIQIPGAQWPDFFDRKVKIVVPEAGTDGDDFSQGAAGGSGGFGYATGGDGGAGSGSEYSGGGGGGGGAAFIGVLDTDGVTIVTPLAVAGGGGGGGGAGADTTPNDPLQNGNQGLGGGSLQTFATIDLTGDAGTTNIVQGGGGGGAGGGWGDPGDTNTQKFDEFGGLIGTTDLDAQGGTSGQYYYNSTNFSLDVSNLSPEENGAGPQTDGFIVLAWPPQDLNPDPFQFTPLSGIEPQTQVESDIVQITGVTGSVPFSIVSNGVTEDIRVGDDPIDILSQPWGPGSTLINGQYIQARMTTGPLFLLTYRADITVGNLTVQWYVENGEPPDSNPTPFTFFPIVDAEPATLFESNTVDIGGINIPVKVRTSQVSEIRIGTETPVGSGTYVYTPWFVSDSTDIPANQADIVGGQRLQIRANSSAAYSTAVSFNVLVGDYTTTFDITTRVAPDLDPDPFTFITLTDQDPLTEVFSNYAEIEGVSDPIDFTVDNGALIELNGVQTGLSTIQVVDFDLIRLYYTTTDVPGQSVTFNVTSGNYSTTWTVVNIGDFGTTPDAFDFGVEVNPTPGQFTTSSTIVTVSGLGTPVSLYGTNGVQISVNGAPFTTPTVLSPIANITNGDQIQAGLVSPAFPGFSNVAQIFIGAGVGTYTVLTGAPVIAPKVGQWYSSLDVARDIGGNTIRFDCKFDGLPVGSMMPVFKNNVTPDSTSFGELDGSPNSRFPGWIYCDGQLVFQDDYPALYDVLGDIYGAAVGNRFRLPDMRNKRVVGTGDVDGNVSGSPALSPDFGPAKTTSGRSSNTPGSHGGMWFVRKIDTSNDQVIPQVEEPPVGQAPQESQFFDIGLIRTTGYEDVSGAVEFITFGQVSGNISLGDAQQFEVPLHNHELVTGIPDPGFKGRIQWGGNGGRDNVQTTNYEGDGSPQLETTPVQINIWGYATQNISLRRNDDTIRTSNTPSDNDYTWGGEVGEATINDGYLGYFYGSAFGGNDYSTIEYLQPDIQPGTTFWNEIDDYIDLAGTPFGGTSSSDPIYKWVAAVDIPPINKPIRQYRPTVRRKHSHYITDQPALIENNTSAFSYGNSEGAGTPFGSTPSDDSISIVFTAGDVGLEVLPGEFTLSRSKQLIPTPSLDPQDEVGLITPYVWVKWLIKAY